MSVMICLCQNLETSDNPQLLMDFDSGEAAAPGAAAYGTHASRRNAYGAGAESVVAETYSLLSRREEISSPTLENENVSQDAFTPNPHPARPLAPPRTLSRPRCVDPFVRVRWCPLPVVLVVTLAVSATFPASISRKRFMKSLARARTSRGARRQGSTPRHNQAIPSRDVPPWCGMAVGGLGVGLLTLTPCADPRLRFRSTS